MNDLATLAGRPRRLAAAGQVYRLFPQTLGTLGRLQEWLDGRTPDPDRSACAGAALAGMPAAARRYLLRHGAWRADRGRPLFGTPAADDLVYSVGGITELLYLSVRRGRPFSRRAAGELYWHLGDAGVRLVFWTVWGGAAQPRWDGGDEVDPAPLDWWAALHRLTNEPHSVPPRAALRLTWPQVLCVLGDGKPPRAGPALDTPEAYAAFMARRAADPWAC